MRALSAILLLFGLVFADVSRAEPLDILVLYDNTTTRGELGADWGFSALVTWRGEKILFDSGTKPDLLLANMKALGVDPAGIGKAVISHGHGDHLNGIYRVYPANPSMVVYFLDAFPAAAFSRAAAVGMKPVRVSQPVEISQGIYSTGTVPGDPPEQALVIETGTGLAVITGCSHPGVARMVEAARRQRGAKPVRLLLGGFHMLRDSQARVQQTIQELRSLQVEMVAPTHCTGDPAIEAFRKAYGEKFRAAGAGQRFRLE